MDIIASVILNFVLSKKWELYIFYILYKYFISLFYTNLFGADYMVNVLNAVTLFVRISHYIGRGKTLRT